MEGEQEKTTNPLASIKGGLGTVFSSAQKLTAGASAGAKAMLEPVIVRIVKPGLQWLQCRWRVVRPARTGLILSIAVSFFLASNDQAKDILRVIAENHWWQASNLILLCGVLVYAFTAWYFSRAALYVFYDSFTPESSEQQFEQWRKYTARVIGVLPILALAFAFWGISWPHAIFYALAAALFFGFLVVRRIYILPWLYPSGEKAEFDIGLHRKEGLTKRTRPVVIRIAAIALLVFLGILFLPVVFPTSVGTLGVLFLGAAGLVVMFTILTYWSDYYDLPSLVLLLVLVAVLTGLYNDNHGVRTLETEFTPGDRTMLAEHFEKWMGARLSSAASPDKEYPVFVVAAEGGGIRAAYWTAAILTELQQAYPDFPCHTFAISGVSGGSLGGGAFVADMANAQRAGKLRCIESEEASHTQAAEPWTNQPLESTSIVFLGEDFLAPTVGGLLFPDLISRVNPFCPLLCLPDRASYLEWAWEENWAKHNPNSPIQFSGDFLDIWESGGELQVPSLVLNGTWVEDGKRTVTSNLKPDPARVPDIDDLLANFDQRIPLSTAVHMSARFTYVSPAGTVRMKPTGTKRIVDGGYFENSGALSARQILKVLQEICNTDDTLRAAKCPARARLYGIIISNNPESPHAEQGALLATILPNAGSDDPSEQEASTTDSAAVDQKGSSWSPLLSETLSPALALFNTRTARGSLAEAELVSAIGEPRAFRFQLLDPPGDGNEIPLGWVLSKQTQEEIQRQAESSTGEYRRKLRATGLRAVPNSSGQDAGAMPERKSQGAGAQKHRAADT